MTPEEIRAQAIVKWILSNLELISLTNSARITIHIKGAQVTGEVNLFPDSKI